jgi:arginyl-tRNA synthetase
VFIAEQQSIEAQIISYCKKEELPDPEDFQWSPIPFSGEWGISTSFFRLAAAEARQLKAKGQKPSPVNQRAQEIAAAITERLGTPKGFSRIEAINGYLNLYFSTAEYSKRVIDLVLDRGADFGIGKLNGQRVMVEYSQPNTHKAFHVGHLRNAILGSATCNILESAGYEVVRANYIGDIGLHVIKWLWNYINFHQGEKPGEDKTRWMGDIYAEADRRLHENPEYEEEVRKLFSRWDKREPEIIDLWKKTRDWSLDGFDQIYSILGVRFDRIYLESEVEDSGKELVEEMIERQIAEDERPEGPVIVRLDDLLGLKKEKYRVLVVLRSDSTSLYSTKDLSLAIKKFEEYDLDRSIYVIDVRQSLYMQQIYKTLEILGYPWAENCYHLAYEIVNLPGNVTMSSRDGTVVLLEDLIREAKSRAYQIVNQKNPNLEANEKEKISASVALGALKYTMLARDNAKVVTFDWESALNFEGQAAPYIQYANVRANSILRRAAASPNSKHIQPNYDLHPTEIQLIDLISRLPGEVQRSAEELKTLHLTNLAYNIARAFNDFYNQCPVLSTEAEIKDFRLRLVAATRQTITNILSMLGIEAPELM